MYLDARLWAFTKGFRWRIALAVLVGLAAAAVGIARLALLGWLLAKIIAGAPFVEMAGPLLLVAAVMLLRGVLEYARTMIAHRTAAAVQLRLRRRLYDKVVELGPGYFGLRRTGEVILSLVDGVEQLETYFGQYLPQLCVSALTPLGIFAFAAFLDLPVALTLLIAALVTLLAPSLFHSWDRRAALSRQRAYGRFGAEFLDALQGLATLKAFGQSRARGRELADQAREVFRSTMWVLATNSLARGITDSGIAIGAAAALAVGAWRVSAGEMSLTALLIILMLGVEVFRPLRDLRTVLHQGMLGRSAAGTVMGLLEAEPPVSDMAATAAATDLEPSVSFEAVAFSYPEAPQAAHRDLSFTVRAGERVGVVGPSGAGKSSIVRLLLRLYDPQSGRVCIGGRDIRTLSLAELRRQTAVVNQDTYLFHGTVEENLRFGKPDASEAELIAAASAANAHAFIQRLPQGYDTVVGERGLKLSGGQRQRIAIARALLRDAPILVLDEALSAVDAENEAVIQQALDRLMRGRTTLIFAHRLSSVIDADRILVLDDGQLVEEGSHAELMALGGSYHRLMAMQAQESAGTADVFDDRTSARPLSAQEDEHLPLPADEPSDAILRAEGLGWAGAARELIAYARPWKARVGWTFVFGVTRVLAFIGVGVASAMIVAAIKAGDPYGAWLVALACLAPAAGVLHWLESWLAHDMAFRLLAEMRIALYDKLEKLAPAYLLRRRSGDLVSMATQDVETVEYFFAHTLAPAFVAVLVPLAVLALLLWFDAGMALALVPFLALVVISPLLMRGRVDRLGSEAREALGDLNAHATDTVQGLMEIVAFQQEASRGDGFDRRGRRHVSLRLPFFRDLTLQTALVEVATGLGGVAVIAAGAVAAADGSFDPRFLPLLTIAAMAAFLPVSEIANIGRQLADTLGATRRLYAVDAEPVTVTDGPGVAAAEPSAPAMALDQVTFAYPGTRRPALADASFAVGKGQTLALVGPSGAGKTTAAHLFLRFWDPDGGAVRLGGHDLRQYRLDELQQQVALVAQDTYLFNESLRGNILLARPDADAAALERAVRRAALSDVVAALPEGLDTPVGERGMRLSGGQRQRVAIARAFLKDAPILILDEATSHLDAVNEQLVRGALQELMATRTTVVIAHRLSTVRDADLIVALEEGRVAETGTHAALVARGGLYAHLVMRQMAGATRLAAR